MHASNSAIYQTIYELQTPLHNTFLKKNKLCYQNYGLHL